MTVRPETGIGRLILKPDKDIRFF